MILLPLKEHVNTRICLQFERLDFSCSIKGIFVQLTQTTGADPGFIYKESPHPSFALKPFQIREVWSRQAPPWIRHRKIIFTLRLFIYVTAAACGPECSGK